MGLLLIHLVAACLAMHACGVSYVFLLDHRDESGDMTYEGAMARYALMIGLFILAGAVVVLLFSR